MGSRARPYHSSTGGGTPPPYPPLSPRAARGALPVPAAAFRPRWRLSPAGGGGGRPRGWPRGRRGAGAGRAVPPRGRGWRVPRDVAGGYKREAPRGTPAAEAAPAVERRDARRGPDRGTHAAGPLLVSSPRALRRHRIAPHRRLAPYRADDMMYQGFAGEYETPSSRCSSASPAGDSLTYYPSPADSFSSMGSPVNPQVRHRARRLRPRGGAGALGRGTGRDGTAGRERVEADGLRRPAPGSGTGRGERPRCRGGAGGGSRGPGRALRRVCKAASLIKREFIEETPEQRLRQRGRQRYL